MGFNLFFLISLLLLLDVSYFVFAFKNNNYLRDRNPSYLQSQNDIHQMEQRMLEDLNDFDNDDDLVLLAETNDSLTSSTKTAESNSIGHSDNENNQNKTTGGIYETLDACEKYNTPVFCTIYSQRCSWVNGLGCTSKTSLTPLPTSNPTTSSPTQTRPPTSQATTRQPSTLSPTTKQPTAQTLSPSQLTLQPTIPLTKRPTLSPVRSPTKNPTTASPTLIRSSSPSIAPTPIPSNLPTDSPSLSWNPTAKPTEKSATNETGTTDGDNDAKGYDIDIIFTNPNTADPIKNAFLNAKKIWESIILTDIPSLYIYRKSSTCFGLQSSMLPQDKVVDDLLIFADISYIDGAGNVLGRAGPCIATNVGGRYVRVGIMYFDSADLDTLYNDGSLEAVILHEMGHVIGFGTLWGAYKLRDSTGEYYTGSGGIEGLSDVAKASGTVLPESRPLIERDGGSGTAGGHWDEKAYKNELMTGWLNPGSKVSYMTVKAMRDIGFEVNPDFADSTYTLPTFNSDKPASQEPQRSGLRGHSLQEAPEATNQNHHDFSGDIINQPVVFDDKNIVPY